MKRDPDAKLTYSRREGVDIVTKRDTGRLQEQMAKIKELMLDGKWRTLSEISAITGAPEASVSAQLRHLRKPKFGNYIVERNYINDGLYEYRVREEGSFGF